MNIAQIPLADGWGMHNGSGWWVLGAALMMLFMGAMMWMMMRGMGGGSSRDPSAPGRRLATRESPLETLARRFAEGEISIEEYRARREALVEGNAQPSADHDEEQLTAPGAGGGRQS